MAQNWTFMYLIHYYKANVNMSDNTDSYLSKTIANRLLK